MKTKNTLLALAFLITSLSFGQITTDPATGNVGIGTTAPAAKLDIVGDMYIDNVDWSTDNALRIREGGSNTYGAFFKYGLNDLLTIGTRHADSDYIAFQMSRGSTNVTFNGNVGIGIASPTAKLEVNGTAKINGNLIIGKDTETTIISGPTNGGAIQIKSHSALAGSANRYLRLGWNDNNNVFSPAISINDDLNVGIGTTNPDQKLTVNGTIHSSEVIVDTNITPDYVFQKYYTGKSELKSDYVMPTLAEIESFTKENNHLPNVPSAKEVQEKGMSLGEMSNVLLQKVEELTLYMIEMKKENDELKAQVKALMDKKQ